MSSMVSARDRRGLALAYNSPFIRPAGTQPTCRMAVNMILTANEEAAKRGWLAKNTRGPPSSRYEGEQVESYAYGRPGSESAADRRARRDALDIEAAQTFQSAARIVNPPPRSSVAFRMATWCRRASQTGW